MLAKEVRDLIRKYVHPFRIIKGQDFQLKDVDPADTCGVKMEKGEAAELLRQVVHQADRHAAIVEAVDELGLSHPQIDAIKKKEIVETREALARET